MGFAPGGNLVRLHVRWVIHGGILRKEPLHNEHVCEQLAPFVWILILGVSSTQRCCGARGSCGAQLRTTAVRLLRHIRMKRRVIVIPANTLFRPSELHAREQRTREHMSPNHTMTARAQSELPHSLHKIRIPPWVILSYYYREHINPCVYTG